MKRFLVQAVVFKNQHLLIEAANEGDAVRKFLKDWLLPVATPCQVYELLPSRLIQLAE